MEELPLGRIAALVPDFTVKDLPLGRTLMMMMMMRENTEILIKASKASGRRTLRQKNQNNDQ